ncbi:MAG: hypothetical protein V9F00_10250 [Nocardioides sp.]
MSKRRRTLLAVLVFVILFPFIVGLFGMVGPIEVLLWLGLLAGWAALFFWAKDHQTT